jgi:hypothetical protein
VLYFRAEHLPILGAFVVGILQVTCDEGEILLEVKRAKTDRDIEHEGFSRLGWRVAGEFGDPADSVADRIRVDI